MKYDLRNEIVPTQSHTSKCSDLFTRTVVCMRGENWIIIFCLFELFTQSCVFEPYPYLNTLRNLSFELTITNQNSNPLSSQARLSHISTLNINPQPLRPCCCNYQSTLC